jgi:long-chain acyl-CoA synthetase
MNPRSATGELVRMVADSGARVAIGDASTIAVLRTAVAGVREALEGADDALRARSVVPSLVVHGAAPEPGEMSWDDLATRGSGTVVTPADRERLAVLLYTSGTSGRPRGVMLSHRALLANIEQVGALDPPVMTADDVVLGLLPLFHVYGLNAVLGQVLARGARLVLVPRFDADETLRAVAQHQVTNLPLAPPVVAAWAGRPDLPARFEHVRLVVCGAAPLAAELATLVTEATGVHVEQGYGLTETAPVVSSTLASRALVEGGPRAADGVGSPLPGVEVKVVDAGGDEVSGDDPGEIRVRGPNLFSGYWPDGSDGPDPDGWWSTGDLAVVEPNGDLVLVDRLRELVIVSGFNVYPTEVEAVISEIDGVAEAAVIGAPDETTGEAVLAFVVSADPAAPQADLLERVRSHCEQRLARFKQPREVSVVEGLPHSATGKVAKGRLRAQARRDALGLT